MPGPHAPRPYPFRSGPASSALALIGWAIRQPRGGGVTGGVGGGSSDPPGPVAGALGSMKRTVQSTLVQLEERGGIRVLRLCRPPVNALNLALAQAVQRAVAEVAADAGCTGVVLTGLPGAFSAGIDTREVPAYDAPTRAEMLRTVNRSVLALYGLTKPVVAAVSGHALGGAFVLMLACDVRLAARGPFQLGLTEAGAGIPFPAGPLAVVRAELAPAQIRSLALGSLAAGPESEAFAGVIDRVVEPSGLLEAALAEVRRLSALPAFGRVKQQLRADTIERLARIVERDEEPLLARWT